jgi:hypothetical protein
MAYQKKTKNIKRNVFHIRKNDLVEVITGEETSTCSIPNQALRHRYRTRTHSYLGSNADLPQVRQEGESAYGKDREQKS